MIENKFSQIYKINTIICMFYFFFCIKKNQFIYLFFKIKA